MHHVNKAIFMAMANVIGHTLLFGIILDLYDSCLWLFQHGLRVKGFFLWQELFFMETLPFRYLLLVVLCIAGSWNELEFHRPKLLIVSASFLKRHPLSRQGRPTGVRITSSASSTPGRGFVKPPLCRTPPTISSAYGGVSRGQLTDCQHQMSSYVQYTLSPCIV